MVKKSRKYQISVKIMKELTMNKIDTKAMREKILDLAMRGKLVPQDPNDEPASELLKRIQEEKEQLIASKAIKKQKPLPPIEEADKPFEIPSSWEWVRLGEIVFSRDHLRKPLSSNERQYMLKNILIMVHLES